MPIIYTVVSRGTTILAQHVMRTGNFSEIVENILAKISPEDGKLTLSHGSYLFHYISESRIIYMCITDDQFERSRAFLCLQDIKRKFLSEYGPRAQSALAFAMNNDFAPTLKSLMQYYTESKDIETITRVQGELDELKNIMVRNIDNVATRGEKLQLLVDKTEHLNASSVSFRAHSRALQRSLFWKNVKLYVILALIVLVTLYIILAMACGYSLGQCF